MKKLTTAEKIVFDEIKKLASRSDNGKGFCTEDLYLTLSECFYVNQIKGYLSSLQRKGYIECYSTDECYFDGEIIKC